MTAQTILPANSVRGGDLVTNSCRFDGASSYMHKTPSSAGNRRTLTFSCWLKRSLPGDHTLFSADDSTHQPHIKFDDTNEELNVRFSDDASKNVKTSMVFRDFSAWYHIVVAIDTTQGTASNRCKIYVNGVQQTSLSTSAYPDENYDTSFNTAIVHSVGRAEDSTNKYFNGYMAEVVYIDGLQLAADQFGEFDSDTPTVWKPIDVSGLTFGTNGFYLDFEDSSNLGNDKNGGTDLTEVGLAATDQSTDTCVNNFPTMNPLDNFYAAATFAEGNLQVTTGNSMYSYNTATLGVASGKWYWEVKWSAQNTGNTNQVVIGIAKRTVVSATVWLGSVAWTYGYQGSTGHVHVSDGNATNSTSTTYSVGDIISVAMDLDNNKIHFAKNGTYTNSSDPGGNSGGVTITAADSTSGDSGFYFPAFGDGNANLIQTGQFNFGAGPPYAISSGNADADGHGNFEFAVPSGYFSLNTKNLAEYG